MAFRLQPHPSLRTSASGTVLVGGSPVTVLRLSSGGAALARQWFAGEAVSDDEAHRLLASRLLDRNMALPLEPSGSDRPTTIVIPVLDDLDGLRATLTSLSSSSLASSSSSSSGSPPFHIVVVDDGSAMPIDPAEFPGIDLVRHERPHGPGAARNAGARSEAARAADVIVFIDAAVVASVSAISSLTRSVHDSVSAVAPRVRSTGQTSALERYEAIASPLDLGPIGGRVRPGSEVSYVPSTCLAVSRDAFDEVAGFDESLRFGEDVDLVWRLLERDHLVEYAPDLTVTHPPRENVVAMARQRFAYGTAAGPLAVRHGDAVAPWRANGWSAVATALGTTGAFAPSALAGVGALGITAYAGERVAEQLPDEIAGRRGHGHRLVGGGHLATIFGLASATTRPWWPVATVAAVALPRPARRVATGLMALGRVRAMWPHRGPGRVGLARGAWLSLVDDTAYGAGVVAGAWRHRTLRPLLPAT